MATPTLGVVQQPKPQLLEPDALEQDAARGIVNPASTDADKGFYGVMLNRLGMDRQNRSNAYMDSLQKSNAVQQAMFAQQLAEQARQHDMTTASGMVAHGYSPLGFGSTKSLVSDPTRIAQESALKDAGQNAENLLKQGQATKAFSDSDFIPTQEALETSMQKPLVPHDAVRLEVARASAANKGGPVITVPLNINGFPASGAFKGPNAQADAEAASRSSGASPAGGGSSNGAGPGPSTAALAAIAKADNLKGRPYTVDKDGNVRYPGAGGTTLIIDRNGKPSVLGPDGKPIK